MMAALDDYAKLHGTTPEKLLRRAKASLKQYIAKLAKAPFTAATK
jgi:hypothetical protein